MKKFRLSPAIPPLHIIMLMPMLLTSCALTAPPASVTATTPAQWYASLPDQDPGTAKLPHNGKLTDLSRWWQQQGDPLLVELIEAAQGVSASVAAATTRIEQSRAAGIAAGANLLPKLDFAASVARSSAQPSLPLGLTSQGALQTAWEIDLFGAARATRDAAQARFDGAQAAWHDARVSVAAEVANQYFALRACENLAAITQADAGSRAETARLAQQSAEAGFQAPATAALARASAAEGRGRAIQQRALCDINIKALVALTDMPEPALRNKFTQSAPGDGKAAAMSITSLPAQILAQRPDVFSAEREVAAASAEVGSANAQRYPRLTLSGSLGLANFRAGGVSTNLSTWSIGPLALSLPLFDGGTRRANIDVAHARYDEAVLKYRSSVRQAVREVEEALVNVHSTAARSSDAGIAVAAYRASFDGAESRYRSGLASLVELEDVRRVKLAAELTQASLERERAAAWVSLYRAAGGGWSKPVADTADSATLKSSAAEVPISRSASVAIRAAE